MGRALTSFMKEKQEGIINFQKKTPLNVLFISEILILTCVSLDQSCITYGLTRN